jgi:hypothetical protein
MSTTVEDVEYLKKYGSKESHLFLVDSSKRDTSAWPTPSEYSVDFQTPFRQVYGVDVIDATVPRTQYNVESFSNEFSYTLLGYNGSNNVANAVVVEPADYEFNDFVTEFNEKAGMAPSIFTEANLLQVSGTYKMDGRTTTRSLKGKMTVTCVHKFRVDPCSMAPVMGFFFDENTKEYAYESTPTSDVTALIQNRRTDVANVVTLSQTATSALKIRQPFIPNVVSGVYRVSLDCSSNLAGLSCSAVITDEDDNQYSEVKNFTVSPVAVTSPRTQSFTIIEFPWKMPFTMTRASVTSDNTKTYYVLIRVIGAGGTLTIYGYNTPPSAPNAQREDSGSSPTTYSDISGFHMNLEMLAYAHRVQPPNLYDFTGDTYLQIRCKEIEQHLFRTRAYETYNAGLAKIPLGIFGFTNQDFDYTSFPPREFHPIGKLSTMTFRFERANGQLYDFKGINHTFAMVIRYYAIRDRPFDSRILNPKYDPDILKYMNEHRYLLKKEDDAERV